MTTKAAELAQGRIRPPTEEEIRLSFSDAFRKGLREDPLEKMFLDWKQDCIRFKEGEDVVIYGEKEPEPDVLRAHRQVIIALMFSGEQRLDVLRTNQRDDLIRKLEVWLEELRETLDLWHPANPMSEVEKERARGAFDAAKPKD